MKAKKYGINFEHINNEAQERKRRKKQAVENEKFTAENIMEWKKKTVFMSNLKNTHLSSKYNSSATRYSPPLLIEGKAKIKQIAEIGTEKKFDLASLPRML